jgi:hypothetical protein
MLSLLDARPDTYHLARHTDALLTELEPPAVLGIDEPAAAPSMDQETGLGALEADRTVREQLRRSVRRRRPTRTIVGRTRKPVMGWLEARVRVMVIAPATCYRTAVRQAPPYSATSTVGPTGRSHTRPPPRLSHEPKPARPAASGPRKRGNPVRSLDRTGSRQPFLSQLKNGPWRGVHE